MSDLLIVNDKRAAGAGKPVPVVSEKKQQSFVSLITGEHFNSLDELREHYSHYKRVEYHQEVIDLQLQPYIMQLPQGMQQTASNYSAADSVTVQSWFHEWRKNKVYNLKHFDPLKNTLMEDHGKLVGKPIIIAGSGPSLQKNARELTKRNHVGLVSALHNAGYFDSIGVTADYYVNLDAGDITIYEAAEGDPEVYQEYKGFSELNKIAYLDKINWWKKTKDKTLCTALHCNPELHRRWQGKILWFDTALQGMNEAVSVDAPEIKDMRLMVQSGGNTLGACHYIAKAILGASQIVFVGADLCFSNTKKFYAWDSPSDDKFSGLMPAVDIYGIRRWTWRSYWGFKNWFEHVACGGHNQVPGTYVNCTEGGILGAYPEGNIVQIRQRTLKEFLGEHNMYKLLPDIIKDKKVLKTLY